MYAWQLVSTIKTEHIDWNAPWQTAYPTETRARRRYRHKPCSFANSDSLSHIQCVVSRSNMSSSRGEARQLVEKKRETPVSHLILSSIYRPLSLILVMTDLPLMYYSDYGLYRPCYTSVRIWGFLSKNDLARGRYRNR